MSNLVKISCLLKNISIQELDYDRLVCMAAICYSGLISTVSIDEQILGEKRTCVKFQSDTSKTEDLVQGRIKVTN